MALKLEVEKLEDVEEAQRGLYVEKEGGGGFQLAVDGMENIGALKRSTEHERVEHGKTKAELKKIKDAQAAADDKARKATEEAARASGNTEALDQSWQKKHNDAMAALKGEYEPTIQSLESDVTRLLIDNVAQSMASDLAIEGSAPALIPHISARLGVEVRDGKRVTIVKGPDGKSSALTIDELKKEIAGNKVFAPLIAGSKASGGGASGSRGGGATGAKQITRQAFAALDAGAQRAHVRGGGTVTD
jgi:hypothetical protein